MDHKQLHTHPSNVFVFCPRCGSKGFSFDGIKAFNCPVCHFRYYINACSAVAVILVQADGSIILTRRKFEPRMGFLDLPGGFVDPGERAEDAVKRELKEELGIDIEAMRFLGSFPNRYVYREITYFTLDMAFVCHIQNAARLIPADDVSEALVIQPSDIEFAAISFPSIVNILKMYMAEL